MNLIESFLKSKGIIYRRITNSSVKDLIVISIGFTKYELEEIDDYYFFTENRRTPILEEYEEIGLKEQFSSEEDVILFLSNELFPYF